MTRRVAIAGAAYSEVGRDLARGAGDLALQACAAALADAGIGKGEVDGIAAYQAAGDSVPGFYVVNGLGLGPIRWFADLGGWMPAAISSVVAAVDAVSAGVCDVALAYRTVKRNRERAPGLGMGQSRVGGDMQFRAPFGDVMTSQWLAMWAQRHMHEHGTTEEHLGHIAASFRDMASRNPLAPLREPITLDDYFASPIVTTPFRVLDCDFPVDGGGAVVVTTLERARDAAHTPVEVLATALATGPRPDWDQWPDLTTMASSYAAADLWRRSGLGPPDVDVAEVYDGFSWLALCWLEDLGFCAKGEGGPFVKDGNIGPGGAIPTNTHGGSLSAGRLHAISHVIECVQQLRGAAGERQVPDATTGVATAGGGTMAGAVLMRRADG